MTRRWESFQDFSSERWGWAGVSEVSQPSGAYGDGLNAWLLSRRGAEVVVIPRVPPDILCFSNCTILRRTCSAHPCRCHSSDTRHAQTLHSASRYPRKSTRPTPKPSLQKPKLGIEDARRGVFQLGVSSLSWSSTFDPSSILSSLERGGDPAMIRWPLEKLVGG